MNRWAFSDESERSAVMLMTVVVAPVSDVARLRALARSLCLPGQRRVHMVKESPRRRRLVLGRLAAEVSADVSVLTLRRTAGVDRQAARALLLGSVASRLASEGVTSWFLDDVPPGQRHHDLEAIRTSLVTADALDLAYDHRENASEPVLWIADVLGWAVGAGGDWKRRVQEVVTVVDIGA